MAKVQFTVGRKLVIFDENDIIMDNGACIQIITKTSGGGWNTYPMRMSKVLFKKLKTCGFLYTDTELKEYALRNYKSSTIKLYKLSIDAMLKLKEYRVEGEKV